MEACMQAASPEFSQLKAALKATWTAGDFGQIARHTMVTAQEFVDRTKITPGMRVLDVACGTGNTAIPAAKAGADVTGIDLAPNSLAQAREWAAREKLNIRFDEGDAEDLPYPDHSFDVVLTMFGAMFAPRPDRTAAELLRVCKPGGQIAMANWTPQGFVGKSFQVTAKVAPPPPGVPPAVLWGDENTVRQRLGPGTSNLTMSRQNSQFNYPYDSQGMVEFFRKYFGPTKTTFARLDEAGQAALAAQLESLWKDHNTATDGTTKIAAEYLDVRAIRA
jgi:ubiquinone/menaquinone biosynthesis C-methylase UbiE